MMMPTARNQTPAPVDALLDRIDSALHQGRLARVKHYNDLIMDDSYLAIARLDPESIDRCTLCALLAPMARALQKAAQSIPESDPHYKKVIALATAASNTAYWAEKQNPETTGKFLQEWRSAAGLLFPASASHS